MGIVDGTGGTTGFSGPQDRARVPDECHVVDEVDDTDPANDKNPGCAHVTPGGNCGDQHRVPGLSLAPH
jgi:hypothetical protein